MEEPDSSALVEVRRGLGWLGVHTTGLYVRLLDAAARQHLVASHTARSAVICPVYPVCTPNTPEHTDTHRHTPFAHCYGVCRCV